MHKNFSWILNIFFEKMSKKLNNVARKKILFFSFKTIFQFCTKIKNQKSVFQLKNLKEKLF